MVFPTLALIFYSSDFLSNVVPNYFVGRSLKLIFNVDSVESCGRERYLVRILIFFWLKQSIQFRRKRKIRFRFAKIARRIWHRQMLWRLLLHFLTWNIYKRRLVSFSSFISISLHAALSAPISRFGHFSAQNIRILVSRLHTFLPSASQAASYHPALRKSRPYLIKCKTFLLRRT